MKKFFRMLISGSLIFPLLFGAASTSLAYQNSSTSSMYRTVTTSTSMSSTKTAVPTVPIGSVTGSNTRTSPGASLPQQYVAKSSMYGTVGTSVSMNSAKPAAPPTVPSGEVTGPNTGTSPTPSIPQQPAPTARQKLQEAMKLAADPNNHPTPDEQKMIDMVNSQRVSLGLKPLQMDMRLVETARLKAADMVEENYFGHTSPIYGSPHEMAAAAGLPFWIGENIATASSVQEAFTSFMHSQPHRENILRRSYTKIGVGIAKYNGQMILVQHFAE